MKPLDEVRRMSRVAFQRSSIPVLPLLLTLPCVVQAQFSYSTNTGSVHITRYVGSGGVAVIPDTIDGLPVTRIADQAFYNCADLIGVTIPNTVTNIGRRAFYICRSLTGVAIPDSVTSIGEEAFRDCYSLVHLTIGSGVQTIGRFVVTDSPSLTAIDVDPLNPAYSSADGVLFDKSRTTLIQYPEGKSGEYSIPGGVITIGDSAFLTCVGVTSVTIPDSVATIGDRALAYCSELRTVTIGKSVNSIGSDPFSGCTNLTAIEVDPLNATYTGSDGVLFDKHRTRLIRYPAAKTGNYHIPESVTRIEDSAFRLSFSLTAVTVPASVVDIESRAFYRCTGLTELYFMGNAPALEAEVFEFATNATVFYLPGTTGWGPTFGGLPTSPWSLPNPLILSHDSRFGMQTNGFGFVISWATNLPVVVEASTNPTDPAWTPLSTNTLTSGSSTFNDGGWTNQPARFYRLRGL